ncbi:MAG: NADH-quinone oxidoreductase subunit N [Limisphaerales bacterium]
MSPDFQWAHLLLPEAVIAASAFVVLAADFALKRRKTLTDRWMACGMLTCLACVAAMLTLAVTPPRGAAMFSASPLSQLIKVVLLALAGVCAVFPVARKFTAHIGEYFALLLLATAGLMLLISSENLLMIFAALELLSVCLYSLAALDKASVASSEAALKYFLFGGMSAAFTLFGISLLYGITGEIDLGAISVKLQSSGVEPVFYVALVMTLVGFAFKLAAAPFHFWAPDVYQGAPTPIAAFIASGSKVAGFFVVARILLTGFGGNGGSASLGAFLPGWMPLLATLAVVSMVAGNLAALVQRNVKRLLAYSAIAHAGYAMIALLAGQRGLAPLLFYVITYALTVLGSFAIVAVVENSDARADLADFAGLSRRAPLLSFCMLVFMLSLAGIPPLSGFFGKFYLFTAAVGAAPNLGLLWLVILAVAASAVSLYYYLQILKQIYAADPSPSAVVLRPSLSAQLAIVLLAGLVIILGCAPGLLLSILSHALNSTPF